MRAITITIGVVVFAAGSMVRAQEPPAPSPSPSTAPVPKAPVPKLRVPLLPVTLSQGAGPAAAVSRPAARKPIEDVPPVTTSARPLLPALPVRRPEGVRPEADPGLPRLFLEAISTVNGKAVAVINDRKLVAGDTIAGARVIRILEHRVELEYQGRQFAIGF
jgi:hypothetical protein